MAARITLTHEEKTRKRIQTSMLLNRLTEHVNSKVDLKQTQVKAIEILLKKSLPDLSNVTLSGDPNNPVQIIGKIAWQDDQKSK